MQGDILNFVSAPVVGSYIQESSIQAGTSLLGYELFPSKRVGGMDLSFIKGKNSNPVLARPVAYDAEIGVVSRTSFEKLSSEMPQFAESLILGQRDMIKLENALTLAANQNDTVLVSALQGYFDDTANLANRVWARPHQLAMSVISTGKVTVNTDTGSALEIVYSDAAWDANNKKSSAVAWASTSTSTPFTDIETVIEDAADDGVTITRLVMNRDTWKLLVNSKEVIDKYNPQGNLSITQSGYSAYIEDDLGITITIENRKYKLSDVSTTSQKFYPDDVVSFLPAETLGSMCFGTTAEEIMAGKGDNRFSVTSDGIGISVISEGAPVKTTTSAVAIVLPSFELIDSVYVLDITVTA